MDNARKITVITPFYNARQFIDGYFTKLSQQTFFNQIEVICVDDCSSDGTYDRLLEYSKKHNNVILIRNETNRGSGHSRNRGLDLATGEYISFLDSDDCYYANDSLERFYKDAVKNKAVICGSAFTGVSQHGATETLFARDGKFKFRNEFVDFDDFQFIYWFQRYLYKRQFLNENNLRFKDYRRFQDPVFLYEVMVKSGGFYGVPYSTYCYTFNNKWKTLNAQQHYDRILAMSDLLHNLLKKHDKIRKFLVSDIIQFFYYDPRLMDMVLKDRKMLLKYREVLLDEEFKNEVIHGLTGDLAKKYNEVTKKISYGCAKTTPSGKTQKTLPTKKTNVAVRRFQFG